MNSRLPLILAAVAASAATALPATAQANALSRTYKATISGEQTTTWSYSGKNPGDCNQTRTASGRQHFTFRSAAHKVFVTRAGLTKKGRWGFADGPELKAVGSRTGKDVTTSGSCPDSGYTAPTTGCGEATWKILGSIQYGLQAPWSQVNVDTGMGQRTSGSLFADCPWFAGPDDMNFIDDDAPGNFRSSVLSAGLPYSKQSISAKRFTTGKSFEVQKKTTRTYRAKDGFGSLTGHTTLRWKIHFKRVKH